MSPRPFRLEDEVVLTASDRPLSGRVVTVRTLESGRQVLGVRDDDGVVTMVTVDPIAEGGQTVADPVDLTGAVILARSIVAGSPPALPAAAQIATLATALVALAEEAS
jgi:hypothetical protein